MQRATNFAVLRCVRCDQVTSLRDAFGQRLALLQGSCFDFQHLQCIHFQMRRGCNIAKRFIFQQKEVEWHLVICQCCGNESETTKG